MANSFITIQEIARAALPRLIENLVFPNLVYKDFSNDFSRNLGDTIQVRKPVLLEAKQFDQSVGTTAQDIVETSVPVTLDKTVDVEITAIQGATNINDLQRQVLEPAAVALAQKINSDGLALYKDIPYICGTAGTAPSTLKDLADVRRVLNANKAPVSPRCGRRQPGDHPRHRQRRKERQHPGAAGRLPGQSDGSGQLHEPGDPSAHHRHHQRLRRQGQRRSHERTWI